MMNSGKTTLEFQASALPGEIIVPMNCGYNGIAIGPAYIIQNRSFENYEAPKITETEEPALRRLEDAFTRIKGQYAAQKHGAKFMPVENNDEIAEAVEIEMLLLGAAHAAIISAVSQQKKSPEEATYEYFSQHLQLAHDNIAQSLQKIADLQPKSLLKPQSKEAQKKQKTEEDSILIAKKTMTMNSLQRDMLLGHLHGETWKSLSSAPDNSVPVMDSVPVGELIHIRKPNGYGVRIHGIACTSPNMTMNDHATVMAKSARATLGHISEQDGQRIRPGDMIILDGRRKMMIINPAPETLHTMQEALRHQIETNHELTAKSHARKWSKSRDGETVKISANIGYADDMLAVDAINASSVGLYRTEFGRLSRLIKPAPAKWEEIIRTVAERAIDKHGRIKTITARTPDFNGDKELSLSPEEKIEQIQNVLHALHKVSLDHPRTFSVMFPQIDNVHDFRQHINWAKEAAAHARAPELRCGSMIESVRSIALLPHIVKEPGLKFLSVGTNDLVANILNFGRYSSDADEKYDPTDPAVLHYLDRIITTANAARTPVSVCGDMASSPRHFALLIGLGYKNMSSAVGMVPVTKELGSRIDTQSAREMTMELMSNMDLTREDREEILNVFNKRELGLDHDETLDLNWTYDQNAPVENPAPGK